MSEHTKGPWGYGLDQDKAMIIYEIDGGGLIVADYECLGEVNARLIAAAPELLEACKLTASIVIDGYDAGEQPLNDAWDACMAAIAKAEGV